MQELSPGSMVEEQPLVLPFIRQCEFAVRKPWQMPERRLLDYLLIFVQEGSCVFTIDGVAHTFGKGEFCLIQPGSVNHLAGISDTVTPYTHFDIVYNPERDLSFPTRAGQIDLSPYSRLMQPRLSEIYRIEVPVRLKLSRYAKFRDTFLQVVEHWQYRDAVMQLKAQCGMTELIAMLLEEYIPAENARRMSSPALSWIASYLSIHLAEPLSVGDMARRAGLSVSRFNDLFKRQYGVTPHQYLLDMRISHACELLRMTRLSQEQIAEYCGFSDIHHFSKAFRKRIGSPPGDYRRVMAEE